MQTHLQCQKASQGLSGDGGGTGRWEKQGSQRGRETPLGVTVCSSLDTLMISWAYTQAIHHIIQLNYVLFNKCQLHIKAVFKICCYSCNILLWGYCISLDFLVTFWVGTLFKYKIFTQKILSDGLPDLSINFFKYISPPGWFWYPKLWQALTVVSKQCFTFCNSESLLWKLFNIFAYW